PERRRDQGPRPSGLGVEAPRRWPGPREAQLRADLPLVPEVDRTGRREWRPARSGPDPHGEGAVVEGSAGTAGTRRKRGGADSPGPSRRGEAAGVPEILDVVPDHRPQDPLDLPCRFGGVRTFEFVGTEHAAGDPSAETRIRAQPGVRPRGPGLQPDRAESGRV